MTESETDRVMREAIERESEKLESEAVTHLEDEFRKLRRYYFARVLRRYGPEREWEEEDELERREQRNAENRRKYDEETEAIIRGKKSDGDYD